jgi:hypothetical protein
MIGLLLEPLFRHILHTISLVSAVTGNLPSGLTPVDDHATAVLQLLCSPVLTNTRCLLKLFCLFTSGLVPADQEDGFALIIGMLLDWACSSSSSDALQHLPLHLLPAGPLQRTPAAAAAAADGVGLKANGLEVRKQNADLQQQQQQQRSAWPDTLPRLKGAPDTGDKEVVTWHLLSNKWWYPHITWNITYLHMKDMQQPIRYMQQHVKGTFTRLHLSHAAFVHVSACGHAVLCAWLHAE